MLRFSLLFAAGVSISTGAVLYSENFNSLGGAGVQAMSFSWTGSYGTSASNSATIHNSGDHRAGMVKGGNTTSSVTVTDYLFAQNVANAPSGMEYFLRTTGVTAFAPNDYTSLTATWNRNGNTVAGHYLTVQVGGNWYVSQTAYTTTGPGQGITPTPLNLLTTAWRNLVDGASLEIGSTTSTYADLFGSGAQITGVGFFIENLAAGTSAQTIRIDDIVIDGIPEPSGTMLSILGLATLLSRRKR